MVHWTAEKDQIIIRGIFKFFDIKSSARLLDYLAKEIGNDCSRKAISHRLSNIRGGGKSGGTRTNSSNANTPKKPTTPRGRPKATPRQKSTGDSNSGPEGPMDDDEEIQSPSAARGKRAANKVEVSYAEQESDAEDDDHGMKKRVKIEPKSDIIGSNLFYEFSDDEI